MKKRSWRFKLISLFMGIMLLSLFIQIFYIIPYIRNQEIEKTKIHQEDITNNIARELDVGLNRIKNRLLRMSKLPEFRDMNIDAMQTLITQHSNISERVFTTSVMNSEGLFVVLFLKKIFLNIQLKAMQTNHILQYLSMKTESTLLNHAITLKKI